MSSKESLEKILELIKKRGIHTLSLEWTAEINEIEPNWEEIFRDPQNWKKFEEVCSIRDYHWLIELEYCVSWDEAILGLDPKKWNYHSDKMKEYFINMAFTNTPGEPFETINELKTIMHHIEMLSWHRQDESVDSTLPLVLPYASYLLYNSYIPSFQVKKLKEIVEKANDQKFLKYINELIKEREETLKSSKAEHLKISYEPSSYERQLISRLLWKFKNSGFSIVPLPEIIISSETPPLFLLYPQIEDSPQEERDNIEKEAPEIITIEEVLGFYIPNSRIVIYQRGLNWVSNRYRLDANQLRAIVLIHELGHWIMHKLPAPGISEFDMKTYSLTDEDVHEGWAQLLTYWIAEDTGGDFKKVYEKLNKIQTNTYRVYENFKDIDIQIVIESLKKMRIQKYPISLSTWEKFL